MKSIACVRENVEKPVAELCFSGISYLYVLFVYILNICIQVYMACKTGERYHL